MRTDLVPTRPRSAMRLMLGPPASCHLCLLRNAGLYRSGPSRRSTAIIAMRGDARREGRAEARACSFGHGVRSVKPRSRSRRARCPRDRRMTRGGKTARAVGAPSRLSRSNGDLPARDVAAALPGVGRRAGVAISAETVLERPPHRRDVVARVSFPAVIGVCPQHHLTCPAVVEFSKRSVSNLVQQCPAFARFRLSRGIAP